MTNMKIIYNILKEMEACVIKATDNSDITYNYTLNHIYYDAINIIDEIYAIIKTKIDEDYVFDSDGYNIFAKYSKNNIERVDLGTLEKLFVLEENNKLPHNIVHNKSNNIFLSDIYLQAMCSKYYNSFEIEKYEKHKQRLFDFCAKTQLGKPYYDHIEKQIKDIEAGIVEELFDEIEMMQDSVGYTLEDIEDRLKICEKYAPNDIKVLKIKNSILKSELGIDEV